MSYVIILKNRVLNKVCQNQLSCKSNIPISLATWRAVCSGTSGREELLSALLCLRSFFIPTSTTGVPGQ